MGIVEIVEKALVKTDYGVPDKDGILKPMTISYFNISNPEINNSCVLTAISRSMNITTDKALKRIKPVLDKYKPRNRWKGGSFRLRGVHYMDFMINLGYKPLIPYIHSGSHCFETEVLPALSKTKNKGCVVFTGQHAIGFNSLVYYDTWESFTPRQQYRGIFLYEGEKQ